MYKGNKIAGIVPARGGSKGIKDKNIKLLAGIPLIGHTLDCIVKTDIFDFYAVSTDSKEIIQAAYKWTPKIIQRPKELASDNALGCDVIRHSINYIKENVGFFDYYMYLQPTSPLRNCIDITKSIDLAIEKNAQFIVSVCECDHSPLLCNKLKNSLSLYGFLPHSLGNRQDYDKHYRINGAIYLIRHDAVELNFYGKDSYAYVMSKKRSIDIDEEIDFQVAEVMINDRNN